MDENTINLIRDAIRDGFSQVNDRLDEHYKLFHEHVKDDKDAWKRIDTVAVEIKVAKRIFYVLTSAITGVLGWLGLMK